MLPLKLAKRRFASQQHGRRGGVREARRGRVIKTITKPKKIRELTPAHRSVNTLADMHFISIFRTVLMLTLYFRTTVAIKTRRNSNFD